MLEAYTTQIQSEHKRLVDAMRTCTRQVAAIAMRRMEQYHARQQMLRKQRQERAASSIQVKIRHMIRRNKHRRECKLQHIAARLIQKQFRMKRDQAYVQRLRARRKQDLYGLRFKYACRINNTFLLLTVAVNEVDSEANAIELQLRGWHPSSVSQEPSSLRVSCEELNRILHSESRSQQRTTNGYAKSTMTRRQIVDRFVREHLDVFRSSKHSLLVLSVKHHEHHEHHEGSM